MSEKVPIIVVLGIDVDGKPHASRFEERDAPFVQRAAQLMGFHLIRENTRITRVFGGHTEFCCDSLLFLICSWYRELRSPLAAPAKPLMRDVFNERKSTDYRGARHRC